MGNIDNWLKLQCFWNVGIPLKTFKSTKVIKKSLYIKNGKTHIPKSGDRGEIESGGHDSKRDDWESKLQKTQNEAGGGSGHALHIFHPHPSGRKHHLLISTPTNNLSCSFCPRYWYINWVYAWMASAHSSLFPLFFPFLSQQTDTILKNNMSNDGLDETHQDHHLQQEVKCYEVAFDLIRGFVRLFV